MSLFNVNQIKKIKQYETYDRLYHNKLNSYERNVLNPDATHYISTNFTASIIDITPDFLFGETPHITTEEAHQELLDDIAESCLAETLFYDATRTASLKGHAFIRLYLDNGAVGAQLVEPEWVLPKYDLNNNLLSAKVYTVLDMKDTQHFYVLEEAFTPKDVTRTVYLLDENKDVTETLSTKQHELTAHLVAKEKNPSGVLPIIELKNNSTCTSDIEGCEDLLLAINKSVSESGYIVSKHSDPKIQVPEGYIEEMMTPADIISLPTGTTFVHQTIDNKEMKVIEAKDGTEIKYVQPNLNLTAAENYFDTLVDLLLMQTKTAHNLIKPVKDGSQVESGKAFKLKLLNTERKLKQKKVFIKRFIREFFKTAASLLGKQIERVDVEFIDLIKDIEADTNRALNLYDRQAISKRELLRMSYPGTDESVIEEMLLEQLEEQVTQQA